MLPVIKSEKCRGCGKCAEICPAQVLIVENSSVSFVNNVKDCLYCGDCEGICGIGAITCPVEILVI